jgi:hypothetical protein
MTIQVHLKEIAAIEPLHQWLLYRETEGPLEILDYISLYRNDEFPVVINLTLDEWTILSDHIQHVNNFWK